MWAKTTFLSLLLACSAAAYAGEFPICMYGVNDPKDVSLLKKAGFSCLQTYRQDPALLSQLAEAAQKEGMKTLFYPRRILEDKTVAGQAQSWPVLAWYLVDEPDVARWSRERVAESHRQAKETFPDHPTAIVVGQGKTAVPFYDLSDVFMVDWYPVPHLPLTSFGEQIALARAEIQKTDRPDKPLWAVVQLFDWKEYKQYRPDNERIGRFPTQEELRFMSYDAIMNGATGLFYFIFTTNGKPLPSAAPDYWARIVPVTQEISSFRPVLEGGKVVKNPVSVAKAGALELKTWKYAGDKYTLVLNPTDAAQPVPEKLLKKKYKPMFGAHKMAQIPAYGVWMLQY